jgi:hypothetical protein
MKLARVLPHLLLLACAAHLPAGAQVVREDDVKSFAGVLYNEVGLPRSVEWSFNSSGGEILFATLDADIYRKFSEHGETIVTAAADTGGGCSGDDGGPGLFSLKVLDQYDQVVCSAARPAPPPGWMRDPRMACLLPKADRTMPYKIRIELANPTGELVQPSYPFLLNISMRKIVPSGANIQSMIGANAATTRTR